MADGVSIRADEHPQAAVLTREFNKRQDRMENTEPAARAGAISLTAHLPNRHLKSSSHNGAIRFFVNPSEVQTSNVTTEPPSPLDHPSHDGATLLL